MPTPERPETQGHHEAEPVPYHRAARFAGERAAGRVYGQLQAAVYARTDCDLSVYRILLDRVSHVAVLGLPPPMDLDRRIMRLLARGELVELPPPVLATLAARRAESIREGPWVERHHRPGE